MKAKEIRDLPAAEIRSEIMKAHEKIFQMRFQAKGKDLENPGLLRGLKKDVARMSTVLREREVARAAAGGPVRPVPAAEKTEADGPAGSVRASATGTAEVS
jgi:large subunit ribosomal protein L29